MFERVTDPEILKQLNGNDSNPQYEKVTDPAVLQQLNGKKSKETVNTFLGQLPKEMPEFKPGTPEFKKLLNEMIDSMALPGINQIDRPVAGAFSSLKNTLFPKTESHKEAIKKATQAIEEIDQHPEIIAHEKALEDATQAAETAKAEHAARKTILPGTMSQKPTSKLEQVEDWFGRNLNIGADHHIRATEAIKNRINSIQNYWSDSYGNLVSKLKDSKFEMPKEELAKLDDMAHIKKLVQEGKFADTTKGVRINETTPQVEHSPALTELFEKAPTSQDINAGDFLSKYKDFRNGLYDMRQIRKTTRDEGLRRQMHTDIKKAEEVESNIKDVLHKGLGEHAPEFQRVNEGYSKHVFPLRRNKIVKSLFNKDHPGLLSDTNMIKQFSGQGESQTLLREIAKQDPEIVRNILGQRYKAKPSQFHNPDEGLREYIDEIPQIKGQITAKEEALNELSKRKDINLKQKIEAENKLSEIRKAKKQAALKEKMEAENKLFEIKKSKKKARKIVKVGASILGVSTIGPGSYYTLKKLLNLSGD